MAVESVGGLGGDMKTIWAIIRSGEVIGVYTTKESAELVRTRFDQMPKGESTTVVEWKLNVGVEEVREGMPIFLVRMLRDGTVEWCEEQSDDALRFEWALTHYTVLYRRSQFVNYGQVTVDAQPQPDCLEYFVLARNSVQAIAATHEHRTRMIASGEWK